MVRFASAHGMGKTMKPISAIILTLNEELHLERCLRSISPICEEIILIDCGSTDSTLSIAEQFGARVLYHPWKNYSLQFNWGLEHAQIKTPWTMRVDADEYLSPELAGRLMEELPKLPESTLGVYLTRTMCFLGTPLRHSARFPMLRAWRTGKATCEQRWMDEHMKLAAKGDTICLREELIDDNLNDLSWWTQKHNGYASREAVDMLNIRHSFLASEGFNLPLNSIENSKRKMKEGYYGKMPLFFRAFVYFCYRYIFKLGFMDGYDGFIFNVLQGFWYRFLVDAKIYQTERYAKEHGVPITTAILDVLKIDYRLTP